MALKIPEDAFLGKPDLFLFPQWFINYANRVFKKLGMPKIKTFDIWKEKK